MTRTLSTLALACLLTATPALADERLDQAAALIDAAIAENRVFVTCNSLLALESSPMVELWDRMARASLAVLAGHPGTESLSQTLAATLEPDAMLPAMNTPFGQVRATCVTDNPNWIIRLRNFDFIRLDEELEALF